jgi:hypothetical protein
MCYPNRWMKRFALLPGIPILCLLLLTGCGDGDQGVLRHSPTVDVVPVADRRAYADAFPLLDYRTGAETPPVADGTHRAPFGVMIDFYSREQLVLCTASHFSKGRALVNAHCLEKDTHPDDFYLVFYDPTGAHAYAAVDSFGYIGDAQGDDVAVLNLTAEDDARWDVLDATLVDTDGQVGRPLGTGNFPVTVWTFDPLNSHPRLAREYSGRQGAVFRPKQCTGFRTQPVIDMITLAGQALPYPPTPVDPKKHLLLDQCSSPPIPGNSGSLITPRGDISHALGAFHWIVTLRDSTVIRQYQRFDYTGSTGRSGQLPPTDPIDFYYVGTDLNDVRRAHPDAF